MRRSNLLVIHAFVATILTGAASASWSSSSSGSGSWVSNESPSVDSPNSNESQNQETNESELNNPESGNPQGGGLIGNNEDPGGGLIPNIDQQDSENQNSGNQVGDAPTESSPPETEAGGGLKAASVVKPKNPKRQTVNDTMTRWDATSCGRGDLFSGFVFVQHALEDDDDEEIDDKALKTIAKAFLDTYNELNSPNLLANICDKDLMRLVETVEVTVLDTTYVKTDGQELAQRNFLYFIEGRGIGSTMDTPVFDHSTIERKTIFSSEDDEDIFCRCSSFRLEESRAPTEEEFKDAFKKKIKYLSRIRVLKNIKDVYKVIEYDAVACEKWDNDFKTEVELEFSEEPEKSDYDVLRDSFQNSYNHLTVNYCDPNFRQVTHVDIEEDEDRRRLKNTDAPGSTKKKKKKKRKLKFKVKGRCKGCKKKTKMFDDETVRRLQEEKEMRYPREAHHDQDQESPRILWDWGDHDWDWSDMFDWYYSYKGKDTCFCSSHPKALRAPSEGEFAKRYNATLKTAPVSHNYQVTDVFEYLAYLRHGYDKEDGDSDRR